MWWNKKLNSAEYTALLIRIEAVNRRLEVLDGKFQILQTDQANLRGRFNRQLDRVSSREPVADTRGDPEMGKEGGIPASSKDLNAWAPPGVGNGKPLPGT